MRGEIWRFRPDASPLAVLVVQTDALADAPTVIGLLVAESAPPAGEPLTVPVRPDHDDVTAPMWVKVTQVHTMAAEDAIEPVGRLATDTLRHVETALALVLDFPARRAR